MPRLSQTVSRSIRGPFSAWLRRALTETGMTLGALVYPTRPHVAIEGSEISYSNLKKFAAGESAPSLPTVLRIVQILSRTGSLRSSMLTALMASYPDALVRVVIGLDVVGLDTYWKVFREKPDQLERQIDRFRFQRGIGRRGLRALPQTGDGQGESNRPARRLVNWIHEITDHCDLLAICVAYAFFCPPHGDAASLALLEVFSQYDSRRESLYWEALQRYRDFNRLNDNFAGPQLYQAERILSNHGMPIEDRRTLARPQFAMWIAGHAHEFVDSVPLLEWVHTDTVRESLGIP